MMGGEEEVGLAMVRPPPPSFAVMMKLLLSNEQCGALIGKGGATVVGLQDRFGTTLKLGGPDDLFPGTFFRPAVIRGTVGALRGCMEAIITVLWQDFCSRNKLDARTGYGAADGGGGMEEGRGPVPPFRAEFTFRLLVPHNASGAVIGKGGKVVRAISEETGAHIKLSSNDDGLTGIPERSIILTGHRDPVHAAACRIFDVLASEMRNLVYAVPGVSYNLAAVYAGGGGGASGGVPGAGAAPGGGHGGGGGYDRGGELRGGGGGGGYDRPDRGYERGHYDGGAPAGGGGAYGRGFASGGGGPGSYGGHGPAGYSAGGPGPRGREAGGGSGGGFPGAHHSHPHHSSSHRGGALVSGPGGYGGSGGFADVSVGGGRGDGGAASIPQQPSAYPSAYPRDREAPPAAAAAWYPGGGGGERRDRSGSGAGPAGGGGGWAPAPRGSGGDAGSYAAEGGSGYAPHGRDAPDHHHLHPRGGDRYERSGGGYSGAGPSAAAAGGSGPYGLPGPLSAGAAAAGTGAYSIGPVSGYGGGAQPSAAALAAAAAAGLGGLGGLPGLVDAYGRPIPLPGGPYAGLYGGPAGMLLGQGLQDAYSIHAAALAAAAAAAGLGLPPHGGLPGGHAPLASLPAHGGEDEGGGSGADSGGSAFAPTQVRRPGGGAHPPHAPQPQPQRRDSHDGHYSGGQYRPQQQQQAQGSPATPSYGPQSGSDASPPPLLHGQRGGAPGLQQHTGIASHASHSIGSASQGSSGASLHSTGSGGTASSASRVSLASAGGGGGSGSRLVSAPGLSSSSSRALLQSVAEHGPPPREEGPSYGYAGSGGGAGGAGAAPRFGGAAQHASLRNVLPSLSAGNAMGGAPGGGHGGGLLDAGAKAAATGHTQRGSSDTALVRPQDAAQSSYLRALLAQHAAAGAADPGAGTGLLPMGAGTGLLGGDSGAGLGFGHGDGSPGGGGGGDAPRFLARGVGDEVFRAHRLLGASGASVSIETATVHVPVAARGGGGGGEHSEHGDPEGADMGAATSMVAQLALGQR